MLAGQLDDPGLVPHGGVNRIERMTVNSHMLSSDLHVHTACVHACAHTHNKKCNCEKLKERKKATTWPHVWSQLRVKPLLGGGPALVGEEELRAL